MPTDGSVADRLGIALRSALGHSCRLEPLGLSSFSATWRVRTDAGALFVKSVGTADGDRLSAEADGLAALAATRTVRTPAVLHQGADVDHGVAWLALEWLDLMPPDSGFGARLGAALGALHAAAPAEGGGLFGWRRGNHLGATPQSNRWHAQWTDFVALERLLPLAAALPSSGACRALAAAVEAVAERLPDFFADGHRPRASLIHGDLWSGNVGMLADGTPAVWDPAVSCSDAEAELAMLELFGTPPAGFWPTYRAAGPLHPGYPERRGLYQLHHLLNHALLFGGGYVAEATALARRLAVR